MNWVWGSKRVRNHKRPPPEDGEGAARHRQPPREVSSVCVEQWQDNPTVQGQQALHDLAGRAEARGLHYQGLALALTAPWKADAEYMAAKHFSRAGAYRLNANTLAGRRLS